MTIGLYRPEDAPYVFMTHQRPVELCRVRGGIMLPCYVVDLTDILEIEYGSPATAEELKRLKELIKTTHPAQL